jgi:O-antigen/teichoic acid export membrane protein
MDSYSTTTAAPTGRRLSHQLGRQGAMLFSGFAVAQICSFARNAIVGYWLSKGDFGVAATITIALQMLETLSDLGADRLLVQASDGEDPRLMAAAHATLLVRGVFTSALLFLAARPIVDFFGIPDAKTAFQIAALVPMIKALMHLDSRRQQRGLQNRNFLLIEVVPQAVGLLATLPIVYMTRSYHAVVWLAILQALLSVAASHALAKRPYVLGLESEFVKRLIQFGWPIWLSAFPLVIVYQGDRIIVGRLLGMDALAGYSAAFMVAMVPGLLAAKVGHALMLPLLSAQRENKERFYQHYIMMCEGVSVAAAAYLVGFIVAGGTILPLAFGQNYTGLGNVIAWLAAMWALRMVQAVPGMALMALGETRPLLIAGIIRASALLPAWLAVKMGLGLEGVAAAGVIGEILSLGYISNRAAKGEAGIAKAALARTTFPITAGLATGMCMVFMPIQATAWLSIPVAMVLCVSAVLFGFAAMPSIRRFIEGELKGDAPAQPAVPETGYATTRA